MAQAASGRGNDSEGLGRVLGFLNSPENISDLVVGHHRIDERGALLEDLYKFRDALKVIVEKSEKGESQDAFSDLNKLVSAGLGISQATLRLEALNDLVGEQAVQKKASSGLREKNPDDIKENLYGYVKGCVDKVSITRLNKERELSIWGGDRNNYFLQEKRHGPASTSGCREEFEKEVNTLRYQIRSLSGQVRGIIGDSIDPDDRRLRVFVESVHGGRLPKREALIDGLDQAEASAFGFREGAPQRAQGGFLSYVTAWFRGDAGDQALDDEPAAGAGQG